MATISRSVMALLGLLLLTQPGCSADDGGVQGVPSAARFFPAPGRLTVAALDEVEFRVEDAEGNPLTATFTREGEVVAEASSWSWIADTLGETVVVAVASVEGTEVRAQWTLVLTDDGELPSPRVTAVTITSGDIPASIQVEWDAPGPSTWSIEPETFEVGYATSPFDAAGFDQVDQEVVPWNRAAITQRVRLEGLEEGATYHLAIRTRDRVGRVSEPSQPQSVRATGHFDLSGAVWVLEPQLAYRPFPGALVDWNGIKAVTGPDGAFSLPNLADTLVLPILVQDGSGLDYYAMQVGPLAPVDQSVEVALLPRGFVEVQTSENLEQWTFYEWLVFMTNHRNTPDEAPMVLRRWETYPVPVYVEEYFHQGPEELVDYKAAYERGVQLWNDVAGFELLEIVDAPVEVGAEALAVPRAQLNTNLGLTSLIRPAGGLFNSFPEFIRVRVIDNFNTQELADRVIAHELGHVLLLPHSPHAFHLMKDGAPVESLGEPSREEAFAARVVAQMPEGFVLNWIQDPDTE